MADMKLSSLVQELKALEFETFEIQDYTEVGEDLMGSTSCSSTSCSCSSCCSTCSSTTSTTSCCA